MRKAFSEKWRQEESLVSLISSAASSTELKDRALEYMQGFQEAALRAGAQNPLMEVLNYIDQHLDGKLTAGAGADELHERALLL